MIRKILCRECGSKSLSMHPEDAAAGWKQRIVSGLAMKPEKHQIKILTGPSLDKMNVDKVVDLPNLFCDRCDVGLPDGTAIVAKTMWRTGEDAPEWESEFLTKPETGQAI